MFGMQTASGVRKLLVRQIRCKAQTLLKRLQTWSLASFKLGRILNPENTVTKSFSTLSAQTGPAEVPKSGMAAFGGGNAEPDVGANLNRSPRVLWARAVCFSKEFRQAPLRRLRIRMTLSPDPTLRRLVACIVAGAAHAQTKLRSHSIDGGSTSSPFVLALRMVAGPRV